jgi:hypothetical protein
MTFVIPDGIDALLRVIEPVLLSTEDDDTVSIQLFDGPEFEWPEAEFVAVGLQPDDLQINAFSLAAGPFTDTEEADILCMIRSTSGGGSTRDRRVRVYAQMDAIREAVRADNTLGHNADPDGPHVGEAWVSSSLYAPEASGRGRCVTLIFTVRVKNF